MCGRRVRGAATGRAFTKRSVDVTTVVTHKAQGRVSTVSATVGGAEFVRSAAVFATAKVGFAAPVTPCARTRGVPSGKPTTTALNKSLFVNEGNSASG